MTLGITPANYSLGTLWYGGRLSYPSQVRKNLYFFNAADSLITQSSLLAFVEMFKHWHLLKGAQRAWITVLAAAKRNVNNCTLKASMQTYLYLMYLFFSHKRISSLLLKPLCAVSGVCFLQTAFLTLWSGKENMWLQVVKKLSFSKLIPAPFAKALQSIASPSLWLVGCFNC